MRYVRSLTDFSLRGNAWSWWDNAAGVYDRGHVPVPGSVLVFQRTGNMPLGHVSTVSAVVDSRTILVDHSFGGPVLWRDMPVIDTSANNDWSQVRVWHGPTNQLGSVDFPVYGFIYPANYTPAPQQVAATEPAEQAIQMVVSVGAPVLETAAVDGDALAASMPVPGHRPLSGDAGTAPAVATVHIPREAPEPAATTVIARADIPADIPAANDDGGAGWLPPDIAGATFAAQVPRRPPIGRVSSPQAAEVQPGGTVVIRRTE
ncbi:MAG: CHAP domain-containing protein [Rhodospirillaceae bacterium]|nr:CHAP domain-containing protein [Rhodospirillaceae bacterium]